MSSKVDHVVIPGEVLMQVDPNCKARYGRGLMQVQDKVIATKAGYLRQPAPSKFWVDNYQKRYVPNVDDMVIGIVTDKHVEGFKVDIGSAHAAALSALAFENATKRNRPNLQIGSLVYAVVSVANRDMEPDLVCTAPNGKSEGYGDLSGGYMFTCSLALARSLLVPQSVVLNALGGAVPFEIAVGLNGRVWVDSSSAATTIAVANAILNSEFLSPTDTRAMVNTLLRGLPC